jgi:tetratricopeptide (TPR) repeat protein
MQDRDYAAAVEAIEAALAQPDQPHDYLRYLKGRALALDGQFEAAVAAFEQMAEQLPDSPWARRARFAAGWASAANRRFEQAAIIYRAEAEKLLDPERKHKLAEAIRELGDAFYSPTKRASCPISQPLWITTRKR